VLECSCRNIAEANNRTDFNCGSTKKATLATGCKACSRRYTGFRTAACSNQMLGSESEILFLLRAQNAMNLALSNEMLKGHKPSQGPSTAQTLHSFFSPWKYCATRSNLVRFNVTLCYKRHNDYMRMVSHLRITSFESWYRLPDVPTAVTLTFFSLGSSSRNGQ
jgi:hypothetical protein